MSVDLLDDSYPGSTRATGFLFGLQDNTPPDDLILPLKPQVYRFNQHPGVDVAKRVAGLSARLSQPIRAVSLVSDWYGYPPNWSATRPQPGVGGQWTAWEASVAELVDHNLALGLQNGGIAYDIWNEPDFPAFWTGTEEEALETWYRGAMVIRSKDPGSVLVGPSLAYFDLDRMGRFLDYIVARDRSLVPQIFAWHEVMTPPGIWEDHAAKVRTLLESRDNLGIREVHIHEYGNIPVLQIPARTVHAIAAIDRSQVDGALRSVFSPKGWRDDTMDGLLTEDLRPTAIWHCYERYAVMTESGAMMYRVCTSNAGADGLLGIDPDGDIRGLVGVLRMDHDAQPVVVQLRISHLSAALSRDALKSRTLSATITELPNGTTKTNGSYDTPALEKPRETVLEGLKVTADQLLLDLSVPADGAVSFVLRSTEQKKQ